MPGKERTKLVRLACALQVVGRSEAVSAALDVVRVALRDDTEVWFSNEGLAQVICAHLR